MVSPRFKIQITFNKHSFLNHYFLTLLKAIAIVNTIYSCNATCPLPFALTQKRCDFMQCKYILLRPTSATNIHALNGFFSLFSSTTPTAIYSFFCVPIVYIELAPIWATLIFSLIYSFTNVFDIHRCNTHAMTLFIQCATIHTVTTQLLMIGVTMLHKILGC